jgi:hypothetical protein
MRREQATIEHDGNCSHMPQEDEEVVHEAEADAVELR